MMTELIFPVRIVHEEIAKGCLTDNERAKNSAAGEENTKDFSAGREIVKDSAAVVEAAKIYMAGEAETAGADLKNKEKTAGAGLESDRKFSALSTLLRKKTLQIGLNEEDTAELFAGDAFVLDFGKEMNGGARILTFTAENASARLRFGESLTEACTPLGEKGACNDHAPRDFTLPLPAYSDVSAGNTGFRFLRVEILTGSLKIKSVVAVNHILKKRARYVYGGTDPLLKQIYTAAKRTVDLCAAGDFVWDGVKRDRLVWVGDLHPEMLALTTLYGRMKNIERSLDFAKFQAPLPLFMNGYPAYSLWWAVIVADYCFETGAFDFAEKQADYLTGLLQILTDSTDEKGELSLPFYFLDWQTEGKPEAKEGVLWLALLAAKKAEKLLAALGRDAAPAAKLREKSERRTPVKTTFKQVIALRYFATGMLDEEEQRALLYGDAAGISTFMAYYILTAIASFAPEKAAEIAKIYYGGMLSRGATTFFEDFDTRWLNGSGRIDAFPRAGEKDLHGDFGAFCYKGFRHSLCHGWAAGVLRFLYEREEK